MRLSLTYLYPSIMSQYGDRGNVLTLVERARRRGIEVEVQRIELGDRLGTDADLIVIGGGTDAQQRLVAEDLRERKGADLRAAVADGCALLAVCAGYQLLGHSYRAADGSELLGVGLFAAHSVHHAAEIGARLSSIPAAGAVRAVGNVVAVANGLELVGFENHGGRTYLDEGAQPFATVVVGRGNNGRDRTEGCAVHNAIGTYLHGPVLPKNPALADLLLRQACARHGAGELTPLPDAAEHAAHEAALRAALAEAGIPTLAIATPATWPSPAARRRSGSARHALARTGTPAAVRSVAAVRRAAINLSRAERHPPPRHEAPLPPTGPADASCDAAAAVRTGVAGRTTPRG